MWDNCHVVYWVYRSSAVDGTTRRAPNAISSQPAFPRRPRPSVDGWPAADGLPEAREVGRLDESFRRRAHLQAKPAAAVRTTVTGQTTSGMVGEANLQSSTEASGAQYVAAANARTAAPWPGREWRKTTPPTAAALPTSGKRATQRGSLVTMPCSGRMSRYRLGGGAPKTAARGRKPPA